MTRLDYAKVAVLVLVGCGETVSENEHAPTIEHFAARASDGLGSFRQTLEFRVADPDGDSVVCELDVDGDGTLDHRFERCERGMGAVEHLYSRGRFTATLRVDDGRGAWQRRTLDVIAPANPAIAGATVALELRTLVDTVTAMAWSPDGTLLATASPSDDRVSVWRRDGSLAMAFDGVYAPEYGDAGVIAWSANGARIAISGTARDGYPGIVEVWDVATRERVARWTPTTAQSVALSPDGRKLASAVGNLVEIYDVASASRTGSFTGHADSVNDVAFSPDGATLASISGDSIRTWDAASDGNGAERWSVTNLGGDQLAYSPDGARLAVGHDAADRPLVCDIGDRCRVLGGSTQRHATTNVRVAWSADGMTLATIARAKPDRTILSWNPATGALVRTLPIAAAPLTFDWNRDGTFAYAPFLPQVRLVEPAGDAATERTLVQQLAQQGALVDPRGGQIATTTADGTVELRSLTDGVIVRTLAGPPAKALAWSRDGSRIAVTTDTGVTIHDATTWARIELVAASLRGAASFSPTTDRLAISNWQGELQIWTATGTPMRLRTIALVASGSSDSVDHVTWSPDGSRIAASVGDVVALVDPVSGDAAAHYVYGDSAALAWSPDGELAYEVLSGVRIDAPGGEETDIDRSPLSLVWSPYGGKLAIGGWDGALAIVDVQRERRETILARHTSGVSHVSWTLDGKTLVSSGYEGRLVAWALAYEE